MEFHLLAALLVFGKLAESAILTSYNGVAITCPYEWWLVADDTDATKFYYCSNGLVYESPCAPATCVDPNFYYGKLNEIINPCGMFCDGTGLRPGASDGSSTAYNCYFMNDDCSMEVLAPPSPYDDFRWVRRTGPSPSSADPYVPAADKGPPGGHTTGLPDDGYMFIEGNRGQPLTSHSVLILPDKRSGVDPMKMNLNYYMNGVTYDSGSSLSVQIQYEENGRLLTKTVWREKGNKGPGWKDATIALPGGINGGYKVLIVASLGTNPSGYFLHDFAVDDIEITNGAVLAEDCQDLKAQGNLVDGYYLMTTDYTTQTLRYCDMDLGGTVILSRTKGGMDFYKGWEDYKAGFSGVTDFWYGLENLAQDTYINNGGNTYTLYIELTAHDSTQYEAMYGGFKVASETYGYQLITTGFLGGSAGNALLGTGDTSAGNMRFSTVGVDKDKDVYGHCAERHRAGWWFNACSDSSLTSPWYPEGQPTATTCPTGLCAGWRTLGDITFKKIVMTMVRN